MPQQASPGAEGTYYSGTLVCKGEGVKYAAHIALQRVIDHLVLLHARFAAEAFGHDLGSEMVSISGKVADRHLCVGNSLAYQFFDLIVRP